MAKLLKQFFRKLKTDLIPVDVLEFLLFEIGTFLVQSIFHKIHFGVFLQHSFIDVKENETPNIEALHEELSMLDPLRRDTLKFLLRHLYL